MRKNDPVLGIKAIAVLLYIVIEVLALVILNCLSSTWGFLLGLGVLLVMRILGDEIIKYIAERISKRLEGGKND